MMQDCFGNATDKFGGKHCSGNDFTKWGTMVDDKVKSWLATPQAKKSGHAAFISACYFHCGSHPTFGIVKCARHLSATLAYLRESPLFACVCAPYMYLCANLLFRLWCFVSQGQR